MVSHSRFRFVFMLLLVAALLTAQAATAAPAAPATPTTVYLPLVSGAGSGSGGGGGGNTSPVSSDERILAALRDGKLDAGTALVYRVYAAHSDPRLPAEYRGDDRDAAGSAAMRAVAQQWAELTPQTQAALQPFTTPPTAPGSWLELRDPDPAQISVQQAAPPKIAWDKACLASAKIKVWYRHSRPAQAALAQTICNDVDTLIWPKLAGLMGRAPLSDANETNNGGDAKFDIYLADGATGVRTYDPAACDHAATYMLVDAGNYQRANMAYNIMMAILAGYDVKNGCKEYDWNYYATATWAKDFVYPDDQSEHRAAPAYLAELDKSIDNAIFSPTVQAGMYLWNLYLARLSAGGGAAQISAIWAQNEQMGSLDAVNAAIPGGFEQNWPLFARANWNRDPADGYRKADQLAAAASTLEAPLRLAGQTDMLLTLETTLPHLSASYYHFTFDDPNLRTFAFYNGLGFELQRRSFLDNQTELQGEAMMWRDASDEAKRGAHVRALVKIGGEWSDEDWTNRPVRNFCRSNADERIEELVLIFSNYEHDTNYLLKPSGASSSLFASNAECNQWGGKSRSDEVHSGIHEERWVDDVAFTHPIPATQSDDEGWEYLSFTLFQPAGSGPAHGRVSGTSGGCALSGEGSGDAGPGSLFVYNYTLAGQIHRSYWGSAVSTARYGQKHTCPNDTYTREALIGSWFFAPPDQLFTLQSDGTALGETFQVPDNPSNTFTWLLAAK